MPGLKSGDMRTADVARRVGYSVQQVRNLERDGVLPPATRTATGYRIYGEVHLQSALAYRALAAGVGPIEAKKIVRAFHQLPTSQALALLDAAHARLDAERAELRQAKEAAHAISSEPIEDVRASDSMSVSELAAALGVRPSTLRHWHAEALVIPDRDPVRGTRRAGCADRSPTAQGRIPHHAPSGPHAGVAAHPPIGGCRFGAGGQGRQHHCSIQSPPRRCHRTQCCALRSQANGLIYNDRPAPDAGRSASPPSCRPPLPALSSNGQVRRSSDEPGLSGACRRRRSNQIRRMMTGFADS
ncbi:MerR family DNA-binding transcriptional regulator [Nonomuraea sp. NPDC005983]|uniref:MerR family DNA-binding transcriptional regulator n=1 Tax=Nonomuraea sp. NPDC005983 TaxID=3155595 RepID=UPI0033A3C51D